MSNYSLVVSYDKIIFSFMTLFAESILRIITEISDSMKNKKFCVILSKILYSKYVNNFANFRGFPNVVNKS